MFDANARYIKEGELFFAEVHSVDDQLSSAGIKCGDILLCSHITKNGRENTLSKIWYNLDQPPLMWGCLAGEEWCWLVYSGCPDGDDFICDKWKKKALNFLGGEWVNKKVWTEEGDSHEQTDLV